MMKTMRMRRRKEGTRPVRLLQDRPRPETTFLLTE
jgi:hypothetical protein